MPAMNMGKLYSRDIRRKFRYAFEVTGNEFQDLQFYVKTISSPTISFEPITVTHQVEKIHYPGRPTWDPIEITLVDSEKTDGDGSGFSSLSLIWNNWLQYFYGGNGTLIGRLAASAGVSLQPAAYGNINLNLPEFKRSCTLKILTATGEEGGRWTIEGTWPSRLDPGGWDYGSSDAQELSMTLMFDRAYYSGG